MIANWNDIGAVATTKNFLAGKFFGPFANGGILATGQFDLGMYANNWNPDPDSWCSTVESGQIPSAANPPGLNNSHFTDPKIDTICQQGANTIDISKRVSA